MKKKPLLRASALTGTIYLITSYTEKPHPKIPGETLITARTKHDMTSEFVKIMKEVQSEDWPFDYVPKDEDAQNAKSAPAVHEGQPGQEEMRYEHD